MIFLGYELSICVYMYTYMSTEIEEKFVLVYKPLVLCCKLECLFLKECENKALIHK